jgi:hypothetical protein
VRRLKQILEWGLVGVLIVTEERRRHRRPEIIDARSRLVLPPDVIGRSHE